MPSNLSIRARIGHFLLAVIAVVIMCFVTAVLADGRSVITLKADPPIITNTDIIAANAKTILGAHYGVGLHHDMAGRFWSDVDPNFGTLPELLEAMGAPAVLEALPMAIGENVVKHPVKFLECKELLAAGIVVNLLGFVAIILGFVTMLVHACALMEMISEKIAKRLSVSFYLIFTAAFAVVILMGMNIFNNEWTCDNPVIPTIKLADSFDLSYGIPFAGIGCLASFLGVVIGAVTLRTGQRGMLVSLRRGKNDDSLVSSTEEA